MVPEIPLVIVGNLHGSVDTSSVLTDFTITFSLRVTGLVALVVLSRVDRLRESELAADDRSATSERSSGDVWGTKRPRRIARRH